MISFKDSLIIGLIGIIIIGINISIIINKYSSDESDEETGDDEMEDKEEEKRIQRLSKMCNFVDEYGDCTLNSDECSGDKCIFIKITKKINNLKEQQEVVVPEEY